MANHTQNSVFHPKMFLFPVQIQSEGGFKQQLFKIIGVMQSHFWLAFTVWSMQPKSGPATNIPVVGVSGHAHRWDVDQKMQLLMLFQMAPIPCQCHKPFGRNT